MGVELWLSASLLPFVAILLLLGLGCNKILLNLVLLLGCLGLLRGECNQLCRGRLFVEQDIAKVLDEFLAKEWLRDGGSSWQDEARDLLRSGVLARPSDLDLLVTIKCGTVDEAKLHAGDGLGNQSEFRDHLACDKVLLGSGVEHDADCAVSPLLGVPDTHPLGKLVTARLTEPGSLVSFMLLSLLSLLPLFFLLQLLKDDLFLDGRDVVVESRTKEQGVLDIDLLLLEKEKVFGSDFRRWNIPRHGMRRREVDP
ncbi:hypothetical protein B0H63DRAFT_489439 [Podospora didyma]|uniref:Uncharacterized protein n=1 Tax=Podospora didyma TaxID=330526 RepID=A0AAE0K049_9PEZI|nr:hypothetical protein B0H63DRAFT_489439 [Podospora didyma]